jgi:hypothetical protein
MLFSLLARALILLDNVKQSRDRKEAYAGNTINVREPRRMLTNGWSQEWTQFE